MTTERDHHTSQTRTNPGIGEIIITIRDRLQCPDNINPSRIIVINPNQTRLIFQYSIDLGIRTRVTIYLTKRNSQLLTTPNVVRFTTTDDEINELSGLCPLNYLGLRLQLLISPEVQDSASTFFSLPPETLKKIVA